MSDSRMIPRKSIYWREQERKNFGQEELAALGETIRRHGILEPIGVIRDGERYVGLWGQRRWLAAELIGLESIPAIVREKPMSDAEAKEIRLIENCARESLLPLERANGLAGLMEAAGLSVSDVAQRVGMNPAAVSKSLSLLNLPTALKEKIDAGAINAAAGYHLSRVDDPQIQAELAGEVASGALSRDGLIAKVKSMKRHNSDTSKPKSRVTAMLDQQRSITLSGSGLASVEVLIDWLEELLGKARKVRPQNLALPTFIHMLRDQSKG